MVRSTIQRLGKTTKPLALIAAADDFGYQARQGVRQTIMEHRPGVGAVGKQLLEKRELPEQRGQDHEAAIAILNIGGGDQRMQQQSQSIDENVALLALDQLAAIKPVRINAVPPFSALFTLWLSMMQAVGLGLAFGLLAAFDVERVVNVLQRAVVAPQTKVVIHRAARWQVLRDIAPLASGAQDIHHMLARRLPPPRLAGGISGSICCHSASVRSLG